MPSKNVQLSTAPVNPVCSQRLVKTSGYGGFSGVELTDETRKKNSNDKRKLPGMSDVGFWTVFTGIVIPFITGILYVRRNRKIDTFNRAAEKFRAAFQKELMLLDPIMTICPGDVYDLLEGAFNKHRAAIEEFLPILHNISSFDAGGLEEAWNEYHRIDEAPDQHHNGLIQYAGQPVCGSSEARKRKLLAKRRIERILYYAQNR